MLISPKSKAYRAAAKVESFYAVCLVGWDRPRPRDYGDNEGVWPVKITIRRKESEAAKEWDQESPHADIVLLEHILVATMEHATRLKNVLNEILLGEQEQRGNQGLRRNFRNVVGCWEPTDDIGRQLWWAALLTEAERLLKLRKQVTHFDLYDDEKAYRIISKKATRGH